MNKIKFILNGCDISFIAEAPEDITLKQLLKQCDRIEPHWCGCGICTYFGKNEPEIIISYDDVKKANKDVDCDILENKGDELDMKYTREDLLKICEQAFVSEDKWHNRDSENAQSKLGECYALLKDGCDFEVIYDDDICGTDEDTIWLYTYSKGFIYWESCYPDDTEEERKSYKEKKHFYLPTQKKLDEANGGDWY